MQTGIEQTGELKRGNSLAAKISIFAALLVLWVSATLVVFSVVRGGREQEQAQRAQVEQFARCLVPLLQAPLQADNIAEVARLVDAVNEASPGLRFMVTEASGPRIAGLEIPADWQTLSAPLGVHPSGRRVTLHTGWRTQPRSQWVPEHTVSLLAVGILVLVIAILVARLTLRSMIGPLEALEAAMSSVSRGRFQPVPVVRSGDEIERLGNSFNAMLYELERSRRQLSDGQEQLEERIRQRSQTLSDALVRAESANRAKSEFLANVSHELRTPLNGILGMIEVTLHADLKAVERENLETARICAESLLQSIDDILSLARIEAGHLRIVRKPFDLRKVLERCLEPLERQAGQKGLAFEVTADASLPQLVRGDPDHLAQVLSCVAGNAVKFTDSGQVKVWVGAEGHDSEQVKIWFEVTDTGPGIPEQDLPLIFEKFTQLDGSSRRRNGGMGLGLAVAHRLLQLQGGRIMVESDAGKGSKFRFWLLLDRAAGLSVMPAGPRSEPPGPGGSRRVLVVDDNPANRKIVASLLRRAGHDCDLTDSGTDALHRLARTHYDLVLLDLLMPVMDGYQTARLIRLDPRLANVRIVAMAAGGQQDELTRSLEAGADQCIRKPVQSDELLAAVGEAAVRAPGDAPAAELACSVDLPLNEDAALLLFDNDPKLLAGVVKLFLQVAPDRLRQLTSALEAGSLREVFAEANKLRVAAEGIAAEPLARLAREVEECALRAELREIPNVFFRLQAELDRLNRFVQPLASGIRVA